MCISEPCAARIDIIFNPPTVGNAYIDSDMKRPHSSLHSKMHLPSGREDTVRLSGVTGEHVAKKVQSSSALNNQEHSLHSEETRHTNGHATKVNEVRVHLPNVTDQNTVLDTVLTAWAILIQRYQRDVFHQFTWGSKDQGDDSTQCISVAELDWASHQTAASLSTKIRNIKSAQFTLGETTIILRDGTNEEVLSTTKIVSSFH